MYTVSEELFNELCKTLEDFRSGTTDCTDPEYLSDGEWLDVFVDLSSKLLADIQKARF